MYSSVNFKHYDSPEKAQCIFNEYCNQVKVLPQEFQDYLECGIRSFVKEIDLDIFLDRCFKKFNQYPKPHPGYNTNTAMFKPYDELHGYQKVAYRFWEENSTHGVDEISF